MTFSEHDELAIELEAQNTHKLELKLFPATLDLYASSKGTVISTLNGEIRSFQKDKVLETKEVTLNPQLIFDPQEKLPGTALGFEPTSDNSEIENFIADKSRQIISATKTLLEPFRSEIEAQVCELKLQQCLERVGKNGEEISYEADFRSIEPAESLYYTKQWQSLLSGIQHDPVLSLHQPEFSAYLSNEKLNRPWDREGKLSISAKPKEKVVEAIFNKGKKDFTRLKQLDKEGPDFAKLTEANKKACKVVTAGFLRAPQFKNRPRLQQAFRDKMASVFKEAQDAGQQLSVEIYDKKAKARKVIEIKSKAPDKERER